jgi:D-alanine-D-alanine ligase
MSADMNRFGRVAVLYGGDSAEREVSLNSGAAVLAGLQRAGVDAHGVDKGDDVMDVLRRGAFDRAFVILHGRGGEDGTIQGALECVGIPYTGSGVLGSALAMDKHRTKLVWQALGIPTPEFVVVEDEREMLAASREFGFPAFVKPVHEGSSVGVTPVDSGEALHQAWFHATRFDSQVLIERRITGEEYTVAILGDVALPVVRVQAAREFYDYEAKYADGTHTRYHCPSGLDEAAEQAIAALSLRAFRAVDGRGWGRVDLLCDEQGAPFLIDVNTAPGMTDHSLVPMAASAAGLDFDALVVRILEQTL